MAGEDEDFDRQYSPPHRHVRPNAMMSPSLAEQKILEAPLAAASRSIPACIGPSLSGRTPLDTRRLERLGAFRSSERQSTRTFCKYDLFHCRLSQSQSARAMTPRTRDSTIVRQARELASLRLQSTHCAQAARGTQSSTLVAGPGTSAGGAVLLELLASQLPVGVSCVAKEKLREAHAWAWPASGTSQRRPTPMRSFGQSLLLSGFC